MVHSTQQLMVEARWQPIFLLRLRVQNNQILSVYISPVTPDPLARECTFI